VDSSEITAISLCSGYEGLGPMNDATKELTASQRYHLSHKNDPEYKQRNREAQKKWREKHPSAVRHRREKPRKRHPLWAIWHGMWQRCTNQNRSDYQQYGGRGIQVCDAWKSLSQFAADMGPRPSAKYTLERKDNSGSYCPENYRWATRAEQMQNTRSNLQIAHNGRVMSLSAWARELGCSVAGLAKRWHKYGSIKRP